MRAPRSVSLLLVALAACATDAQTPSPAVRAAPAQQPASFELACAELARLHVHESGTEPATAPRRLHVERVRELFRRADAFGFSGGFLISRGGEVLAAHTCGFADRAGGVRMSPETVFDVGSVAKQFTAAGALRLVELGKLRTDDLVSAHLADVPPDKQSLRVHHLLTHTAGFAHDVGALDALPARDDAVREILASPLQSEPGAQYAYSNAGYALLAAIVERAASQRFESFLREELWLPLGLTHTGMVLSSTDDGALLAEGLAFNGPLPARRPEEWDAEGLSWLGRGSGGMRSTLVELGAWCEALRTGRVFARATSDQIFWPHARENVKDVSYYGYGWQVTTAPDGSCLFTHNGSAGIHYDVVCILPEHAAVLVTFSTQQRSPWRDFPERVLGVLVGTSEIELPPVAEPSRELAAACAGTYRLATGETLSVELAGDRLMLPVHDAVVQRLFSAWPRAEPEAIAALGDRTRFTAHIVDGIARGDFAPLLERLRAGVDVQEEQAFWRTWWPRWIAEFGPYAGTELIDTVRTGAELRTLALVRFERSALVVGFVHADDGRGFIDTMSRRFAGELVLAPQGDGGFLVFHPHTKRSIRVRFERAQDETRLIIGEGAGAVRAVRVR